MGTPNNQSDPYAYSYRLIASVDIIGSAGIKGRSTEIDSRWVDPFKDFFEEFPQSLAASYGEMRGDKAFKKCTYFPSKYFRVWKLVGDEILFQVELSSHKEAAIHCIAFRDAITKFNNRTKLVKVPPLSLKGVIWGAGFPVTNRELVLQGADTGITELIGPNVDVGFRLTALATTRKIPVSADLAWLLGKSALDSHLLEAPLHLCFDGALTLKGINGGLPYPVFWIDRNCGLETAEDKLLKIKRGVAPHEVVQYLEEFFCSSSPRLRKPFIASDQDEEFSTTPSDISQMRDRIMSDDPDYNYKMSVESVQNDASSQDVADISNKSLRELSELTRKLAAAQGISPKSSARRSANPGGPARRKKGGKS